MSEETIALFDKGDGRFTYTQMTLAEEHYCELVAEGKHSRRAAYRVAFNKPDATNGAIDQWLHRVKKDRPDIAARIQEYKDAVTEERMELWMNRKWTALEHLWTVFLATIGDPKLSQVGAKCYQLMAPSVGWMSGEGGSTTNITVNNTAVAGALPRADANAKIQKLLDLAEKQKDNDNENHHST